MTFIQHLLQTFLVVSEQWQEYGETWPVIGLVGISKVTIFLEKTWVTYIKSFNNSHIFDVWIPLLEFILMQSWVYTVVSCSFMNYNKNLEINKTIIQELIWYIYTIENCVIFISNIL